MQNSLTSTSLGIYAQKFSLFYFISTVEETLTINQYIKEFLAGNANYTFHRVASPPKVIHGSNHTIKLNKRQILCYIINSTY